MRIQKKLLKWQAASLDVVKHRLYCEPEGTPIDYLSSSVDVQMPTCEALMPDTFGTVPDSCHIGISALDDKGNESDIIEWPGFFDFVPPNAPIALTIEDY